MAWELTSEALVLSVSDAVRAKIVEFEVGNRAYYEKYACRPMWPGGMSGVTIGIGYDLGQHTVAEFTSDWAGRSYLVPPLLSVCGLKGDKAKEVQPSVASIRVAYDDALDVFTRTVLPRYMLATEKVFPNCGWLPQDAFGALVDLVFNRGPGLDPHDQRRREMVLIGKSMAAQNFAAIPAYLRTMKRLWPYSTGLQVRREWEATTFEHALAQGVLPMPLPKIKPPVFIPKIKPVDDLRDTSSDVLNEQELELVRRVNHASDPLGR